MNTPQSHAMDHLEMPREQGRKTPLDVLRSATLANSVWLLPMQDKRRQCPPNQTDALISPSGDKPSACTSIYLRSVRQHPSSSPNDELRRRNPSKLLVALDTSDHMSMRAAIDRILRRPDLVGLEQTHKQGTRTSDHDSQELDKSPSWFPNSQAIDEGVLPTLYPPQSNSEADFWNTFDDSGYAEQQHSVNLYPHTPPPYGFKWSNNTFQEPTFPLTPCPSGSQTSDNLNTILDFDTSPLTASLRFGLSDVRTKPLRSAAFQEATCSDEEDHDVTTKPIFIHSAASSPFHRPVRISTCEAPVNVIVSPICERKMRTGSRTFSIPYTVVPSRRNDCAASVDSGLIRCATCLSRRFDVTPFKFSPSTGIIEDIVPNDLPLDFLSDPDPWATIGQILNLEPAEQHVEQSAEIEFTKEREGVGYGSIRRSNVSNHGSFDAMSSPRPERPKPDVKPINNFWTVSRAHSPVPEIGDRLDDCTLPHTPSIPRDDTVARPPVQLGLSPDATKCFQHRLPENEKASHADACKRASPVGSIVATAVAEYTHAKRGRDSSSTAGATAAEVDDDVMYNGPCLFGDSDFEEDE
ncbi:hypothetical protein BU15DRAFT_69127 [Melanogaster broomeanus]|nr:hypothetical protein BU15DRAFT_69127 [Melanogaster broomeanus]